MDLAYLNGFWSLPEEAKISAFDRGFMFGDGVYEVLPVYFGKVHALDKHLLRLKKSLEEVKIKSPMTGSALSNLLLEAARKSEEQFGVIYLQITRGIQRPRDHKYPSDLKPTIFLSFSGKTKRELFIAQPISVALKEDFRWGRGDIKSTSLIGSVMLKNEAVVSGFDDAILIRDDKYVTEATTSNVFAVKKGSVLTPKKTNLFLHGITRELVIEICKKNDIPVKECKLEKKTLFDADEVWLTSSARGVAPVNLIEDKKIPLVGGDNSLWGVVTQCFLEQLEH